MGLWGSMGRQHRGQQPSRRRSWAWRRRQTSPSVQCGMGVLGSLGDDIFSGWLFSPERFF